MLGNIGAFDEDVEEFENYVSRVKLFFTANAIKDENRVAVFLTLAGPKIYSLAKSLLSPVDPANETLDNILKKLSEHFKPKCIVIFERYRFYSRNQKQGESIADFLAAIRALAHTCNFGDSLDDMLRDRLVMGLSNKETQHALLAESDLTLDRALEIATAREAATRDVQAMAGSAVYSVKTGEEKNQKKYHSGKKESRKKSDGTNSNRPSKPCYGCGGNHWKKDCPHAKTKCHKCGKIGHIARVCKNMGKQDSTHSVQDGSQVKNVEVHNKSSYDYLFTMQESSRSRPMLVNVQLQGVATKMELDTGAARSIMSRRFYENLWPNTKSRPKLRETSVDLRVYGGSPLDIAGEITVHVTVPSTEAVDKECILVITEHDGPCLLGRDWIRQLNLDLNLSEINLVDSSLEGGIASKFPGLFSPGLGCFKGQTVRIEVDPSVQAKYCKARNVPYALTEKVDLELDRLQKEGIISPVQNSAWAAPIVPVVKSDQSIRICGDYRLTVNKAARMDTYPIPKFEDLRNRIAGGKIFSKLDMSQAYAQLCLDEDSKKYTVINTQRGLFEYNRLCFGISAAPGIFQRTMENLLREIPGVSCYLDDVLISGRTAEEHEQRLHRVLTTMEEAGLKLKLEKCALGVSQITYLGYLIDGEGVHPTQEKVEAITKAPAPTNVAQLQSYLGMFNFYAKFVPKVSTLLWPLNRLLQKQTKWRWTSTEEKAFENSKKALAESGVLVHFDPTKPIVVVADSSSYGVGVVLCHLIDGVERPVCFASRTLNKAERNYSQLEKEALALVFGVRKFHNYLWGQSFSLITDHKPLLGVFSNTKQISPQASGRIQRWSLLLQAYQFTLKHRSGRILGTADALSRLPQVGSNESTPVPGEWSMLVNFLDWAPVTSATIAAATRVDPILGRVAKACEMGWQSGFHADEQFLPFFRRKDELSLQDGCVLWGSRVVIPTKLRESMLKELHAGHAGASRMKELARSYLWWPKLDTDIEEECKSCTRCLEIRKMPNKAELHPWEWPKKPWHRLHIDYAGPINQDYFLIISDAHSKWCDIYRTTGTSARVTIQHLQHCFATHGLPVSIVTDNGPCFTSQEFKDFIDYCGIHHMLSAVYKPSTNGLAERTVQTFKRYLKLSDEPVSLAIDRFLYNYRITPHSTTGVSPAELLYGRKLRTRLDLIWPSERIAASVSKQQERQKHYHTSCPRDVQINVRDPVMIRNYLPGKKWVPAQITEKTGPLSYRCKLDNGVVTKRHQDQIILRKEKGVIVDDASSVAVPEVPAGASPEQSCEPALQASPMDVSPKLRRSSRRRKPVDRLNL